MNIIREHSKSRIVWDCLILILIFVSCAVIPYLVVFQGRDFCSGVFFLYVIDVIFLLDIYFNFNTTHCREGSEETDCRLVRSRYFKSMFAVDLLANLPLDLLFICFADTALGGISLVAFMRIFRLLRVVRMFVIFKRWERMGWTNPGYLRIAKFMGVVGLLIHWLACAWFLVASIDGFPADSWVIRYGLGSADAGTQYIRSLYWAITTMTTVGYGDIIPARFSEYILAMIVMLLGASMYAFIIGNVASLLSNLDSAKAAYWHRMEAVAEYLRYRHVPKALSARVRGYYEYLWAKHRGLRETHFFQDLPDPLRRDLLIHVARDMLEFVPLFRHCTPALRDALLMALESRTYDPGSEIVRDGEVGKDLFFVCQGNIEVITAEGKCVANLDRGDYFGHMSLVLKEKRTACAVAKTYSEIFVLTQKDFNLIRDDYPELREVIKKMSSEASEKLAALMLEGVVL
ncbi:MAG: ion transporter [Planctomycetota bacterium]